MEEVTDGNISASLKECLGPWATGRSEEMQIRNGKSASAPLRQTYSWGVNCGERKPSFLWLRLHPQIHLDTDVSIGFMNLSVLH